jgi:hypothetical protein
MGLSPPFEVAAADEEARIYLVELAHRPRAYLAEEVASVDAAGAEAFAFDRASVGSPRSVVEGPFPDQAGAGPPGGARIARSSTDEVVVEVEALRPALLVLNDQVAPGWRALVDGTERPILTANYLARGVWVDAGRHRVDFVYRTPGLAEGWAAVGALGVALVGWGVWRRRSSAQSEGT